MPICHSPPPQISPPPPPNDPEPLAPAAVDVAVSVAKVEAVVVAVEEHAPRETWPGARLVIPVPNIDSVGSQDHQHLRRNRRLIARTARSLSSLAKHDWVIDYGATHHLSLYKSQFRTIKPIASRSQTISAS